MIKETRILFLIFYLFLFYSALSQGFNPPVIYTVKDGLSHDHVVSIAQDSLGYLWLATWDGVSRFDGSEFRNYYHDPGDTTSISYFVMHQICVDKYNNVWMLGGGYLCRYDRINDRFIRYLDKNISSKLTHQAGILKYMAVDKHGELWISGTKALVKYDYSDNHFKIISIPDEYRDTIRKSFQEILFDNRNNLWIKEQIGNDAPYDHMIKCTVDSSETIRPINRFVIKSAFRRNVYENVFSQPTIFESKSGTVWYFTIYGLYYLTPESTEFILFDKQEFPEEYFGENQIAVWAEKDKGLYILDHSSGRQCQQIRNENVLNIISYFIDRSGTIWFCNQDNLRHSSGLSMLGKNTGFFRHYLEHSPYQNIVSAFGLWKDRNEDIWIGCSNFDKILKINAGGTYETIDLPFERKSRDEYLRTIVQDNAGNLWMGFFNNYLFRFDPLTGHFSDCTKQIDEPRINKGGFRLLYLEKDGSILCAGRKSFVSFDPLTLKINHHELLDNEIYSIYMDSESSLWIGSWGTLINFNPGFESHTSFLISEIRYNVEDISPGDSSTLWLALLGGGLCRFDKQTYAVKFYSTRDGLANNTVYSLLKDYSGNLWMGTDDGISMFNPSTNYFRNFNAGDGLALREFNSESACKGEDGELLFGGVGEVVGFYPDSLPENYNDNGHILLITGFKVSGQPFLFSEPTDECEIFRLPCGTNNFQIQFACLDFKNAGQLKYRYRLRNVNKEWNITDIKSRWINYTNLKPGHYDFDVDATGRKGDWTYSRTVTIIIPPYFHQTVWFKLLIILTIAGTAFLLILMYIRQVRLDEHRKQEQLKLETLRGQMNPHFIYNSLNSINYFISLNDKLNANQYISDFSRLMRSILSNSANEYISLDKEIESLNDYLELEHLRFSEKFDYSIEVDTNLDKETTIIAPSMVQAFAENAIWHGLRYLEGRKGKLTITYRQEVPDHLECIIEDDGIGRQQSVQRKTDEQKLRRPRGISIIQERLKILNSMNKTKFKITIGDLYPEREETGTRVVVEIPVRKT